jgi:hypothetical protein
VDVSGEGRPQPLTRKQGGGSRRSTVDGGEGNEPTGGKASTRGRPDRGGEGPDTGPGISADRPRTGQRGGAAIAPDQRGKVMALLQVLLLEAAVERAIDQDATTNEEAGDDGDRA